MVSKRLRFYANRNPNHLRVTAKPDRFLAAQSTPDDERGSVHIEDARIEPPTEFAGNEDRANNGNANLPAVNVPGEHQ